MQRRQFIYEQVKRLILLLALWAGVAVPQAIAQTAPRVIVIGDSVTDDFGNGGWRGALRSKLAAVGQAITFVGTRSDVAGSHEAYGGTTSCDFFTDRWSFMADTYGKAPTWDVRASLAATAPNIAIIHIGTNNYFENIWLHTGFASAVHCGLNPGSLQRLWDAVVYYPGITGVVVSTVEDSTVADGTENVNAIARKYVADRRAQGQNVCLGELPPNFAGLTVDVVHLNAAGKEEVANALVAPTWTAIAGTCVAGVSSPPTGGGSPGSSPLFNFPSTGFSAFTSAMSAQNPVAYRESTVGLKFTMTAARTATAIRFYKVAGDDAASRQVGLYSAAGTLLASAASSAEPASGWVSVPIPATILNSGSSYVAAVFSPTGAGPYQYSYHAGTVTAPSAVAPVDAGVYVYHPAMQFPVDSYLSSGYFVDVDVQ